ncbi:MAG: hypothetical protein GY904_09180 [Planctomycetaceae bacterium]|jgi:hypothetical protein|nr:hypothetical protein [Planctomycetaceae bacterium]
MSEGVNQLLFSPMVLLWLAGSAVAVLILLGDVNRRRSGLTDSLRDYANRSVSGSEDSADADSSTDSPATGKAPDSAGNR